MKRLQVLELSDLGRCKPFAEQREVFFLERGPASVRGANTQLMNLTYSYARAIVLYLYHPQTSILQHHFDRGASRIKRVLQQLLDCIGGPLNYLDTRKVSIGPPIRREKRRPTSAAAIWLTTSSSSFRIGFGPTGMMSISSLTSIATILFVRSGMHRFSRVSPR